MENFDKLLLGYNGWVRFWRLHAYTHHFNESHKCLRDTIIAIRWLHNKKKGRISIII